jgi:hypothetical protein
MRIQQDPGSIGMGVMERGISTDSCRGVLHLYVLVPHEGPGIQKASVLFQGSLEVHHCLRIHPEKSRQILLPAVFPDLRYY